jgi:signal transduction histidine kinase
MQAHPLSSPAARIPLQSLPPASQSTPPPHQPTLAHRLSVHESGPSTSFPPDSITPGIAHNAGLAHDAGNLLGALGLYCDLLRVPGVLRPEHRHYATELSLISSRSSDLIRRLLALSPTPTPPSSIDPPASNPDAFRLQPADVRRGGPRLTETPRPGLTLAAVLHNLAPVLQRIAAGAATVSVSAPAYLPAHNLSPEALERITVNLVRNAVEAIRGHHASPAPSAPHGTIRVNLGVVAGRLQLTVEDNGPGIPPPIAAAFLRPTAPQPSSGRGLGHRIVHELVTSSGGQISIRTRPGNGTAFCLKWPLTATVSHHHEIDDTAHVKPSTGLTTIATPRPGSLTATQKGSRSC